MKKVLYKTLLTIVALLCSIGAMAHDFEVDGIYYNIIDETDRTVRVTYRGTYYGSYSNEYTGSVVIPESVTYNETTYSVTSIDDNTFYQCNELTSITIPNSVTSIGEFAFYNCTGLTSVTISNGVTSIGNSAFRNCKGLTEITIPNSVTSIGNYAFRYCDGLNTVTIGNSVTSIGENAFSDTPYYNNMPNGVIYLGKVLYKYKGTMPENTTIAIEEGTVSISSNAFYGFPYLTEITIPNSVTSIGNYAFYNCSGLTEIIIPESVTSIGRYAFYSCGGLTSVTIPEGIIAISDYTFAYCTSLKEIIIPESVTTIGGLAFNNCTGLTEITCLATTPPTISGVNAFNNVTKTIPVYVPDVSAYQAADGWKEFTNILPLNANITTENVYYLDCNDQTEWAVEAGSNVQAVFTNVITGYKATVQGSVVQNTTGEKTYTSVVFYFAEGNSYVATNGVENARYTHVEFKFIKPDEVALSGETVLTTGAMYYADSDKTVYKLSMGEWINENMATDIEAVVAEDAIAVRGDVVTALGDIYVYNMSGVMVAYGNNEIDLSTLQRGIYLIHAGDTVKKVVR